MKIGLVRLGGILLGGAAMLILLPACGGSTGNTSSVPTVPQATATSKPSPASVPTAIATPAPSPARSAVLPPTPTVSAGGGDLLGKGKIIFDKTAGGVGCAYCHGLDGKGKGTAGVDAPPNRGKTEEQLRTALINVQLMSFIKLNDEEIKAVVAYLQYLNEQP